MKYGKLKKSRTYELRNDKSLGVQAYSDGNDYPQQVIEIVEASGTGQSCVNIYKKFISGRGFSDNDFYRKKVNRKGQTVDYILDQISDDYARFGGFALHLNYNANFKINEIQIIPFENIRFEKLDDEGQFSRVAVHPDWGKRLTNFRRWRKEDIEFFDLYNPNPSEIEKQVTRAGGWDNYNGQIYYFSNAGEKTYPTPIFSSRLTDMNTEEGISNVQNRNARNNFFIGGLLIEYLDGDESEEQSAEKDEELKKLQGDENAGKILRVTCKSREEKPDLLSFRANSYDKEFDVTEKSVQNNIGQVFNQPPILRSEDVGGNFGADLMRNAYDFYNSVTENERLNIERVFVELFLNWWEQKAFEIEILPCEYKKNGTLIEEIGEKGFENLMKIIENKTLEVSAKRRMVKRLFNLTDEDLDEIIPV